MPGKSVRVSQHAHRQEQGLQGVIFGLDGVLVTTDRYHYQAWKELADELGIPFDEERNHALRGVSREESLRRIYDQRPLPAPEAFAAQCDRKNKRYRELISQMTPKDVLPGALELLKALRAAGIKTAIASASKNAMADEKDPTRYSVDHSSFFYLMDANGQYVKHFPHSVDANVLAEALAAAL